MVRVAIDENTTLAVDLQRQRTERPRQLLRPNVLRRHLATRDVLQPVDLLGLQTRHVAFSSLNRRSPLRDDVCSGSESQLIIGFPGENAKCVVRRSEPHALNEPHTLMNGIVTLLGMRWFPGNSRRFPDAISPAPTLRQPLYTRDVGPTLEAAFHLLAVRRRRPEVTSGANVLGHGTIRGQKALGMTRRRQPCMRYARCRVGRCACSHRLFRERRWRCSTPGRISRLAAP